MTLYGRQVNSTRWEYFDSLNDCCFTKDYMWQQYTRAFPGWEFKWEKE
jgi:hypothetical protein